MISAILTPPNVDGRIQVHNNISGKSVRSVAESDMWTESIYSGSLTDTNTFPSIFTQNQMSNVS